MGIMERKINKCGAKVQEKSLQVGEELGRMAVGERL